MCIQSEVLVLTSKWSLPVRQRRYNCWLGKRVFISTWNDCECWNEWMDFNEVVESKKGSCFLPYIALGSGWWRWFEVLTDGDIQKEGDLLPDFSSVLKVKTMGRVRVAVYFIRKVDAGMRMVWRHRCEVPASVATFCIGNFSFKKPNPYWTLILNSIVNSKVSSDDVQAVQWEQ